ncbi:hypothetical protein MSAN_01536400 [Mycena sanguinolenta]|uniref:Uncharacterized protein n=1 Tax=Mycena sanguinolenta TaxID=230812 RepID=A0A8H7CX16_9AGAR|nr:hypothetical protein MSAN_01536400 [Mycena sanguinolenta]
MVTAGTLAARGSLVPLDNFLGAWLIGIILATCVYGISLLQAYLYYTAHSRRDGVFLKSFVGAMVFMDGFHLTLLIMGLYNAVVTNFGDYTALGQPPWTLLAQVAVGGVLGTSIQTSYAYRVWMLSRSPFIPIFVVLCTWSKLGLGIVYTRRSFALADTAARLGVAYSATPLVKLEVASLSLEMTCDVLISAGMVTNRAINTLVAFFVRSGVLNLIFAVCSMVTWIVLNHTLIDAPHIHLCPRPPVRLQFLVPLELARPHPRADVGQHKPRDAVVPDVRRLQIGGRLGAQTYRRRRQGSEW